MKSLISGSNVLAQLCLITLVLHTSYTLWLLLHLVLDCFLHRCALPSLWVIFLIFYSKVFKLLNNRCSFVALKFSCCRKCVLEFVLGINLFITDIETSPFLKKKKEIYIIYKESNRRSVCLHSVTRRRHL